MKSYVFLAQVLVTMSNLAFSQGASDYYFPLQVGNYWVQHTDTISGGFQATTFRIDIEAIDLIGGKEYFRMAQKLTADDGSWEGSWYAWPQEDSTGIVIGAFGDTSIVDSATIFDPPGLFIPNEMVNLGYTWEFDAPEMGGHFSFKVESIFSIS